MKVIESIFLRLLLLEFSTVVFSSVIITSEPRISDSEDISTTIESSSAATDNTSDDLILAVTPSIGQNEEPITKNESDLFNGSTLNESQTSEFGVVTTQKKMEDVQSTETTTSSMNATTVVQSDALKTPNMKKEDIPPPQSKLDTTIIGTLIVGAVIVFIIVVSVVIIIYVMHIWRVKMIQSATHPSVLYSMLRQNENEPEDQLGEILVSVGLASEADVRPPSSSETEDSSSPPPETSVEDNAGANITGSGITTWNNPLVDPWDLECLSTVPLTDSVYRYRPDESDEELLE